MEPFAEGDFAAEPVVELVGQFRNQRGEPVVLAENHDRIAVPVRMLCEVDTGPEFVGLPFEAAPDQCSDILSGGDLTRSYFFASYYGLWVAQIPPEAASVTLHFDRYGEDVLSFTLPLKGGT